MKHIRETRVLCVVRNMTIGFLNFALPLFLVRLACRVRGTWRGIYLQVGELFRMGLMERRRRRRGRLDEILKLPE